MAGRSAAAGAQSTLHRCRSSQLSSSTARMQPRVKLPTGSSNPQKQARPALLHTPAAQGFYTGLSCPLYKTEPASHTLSRSQFSLTQQRGRYLAHSQGPGRRPIPQLWRAQRAARCCSNNCQGCKGWLAPKLLTFPVTQRSSPLSENLINAYWRVRAQQSCWVHASQSTPKAPLRCKTHHKPLPAQPRRKALHFMTPQVQL